MSTSNFCRGGDFATSRKSSIAEDLEFIRAKAAAGVPDSAIARMIGRNICDVRKITQPPPIAAVERAIVAASLPPGRRYAVRSSRRRTTPDRAMQVLRVVCARYGVHIDEITGDSAMKPISRIRDEACWLIRQIQSETGKPAYSTTKIGQMIGGRDHTSIGSAIGRHEERLRFEREALAA